MWNEERLAQLGLCCCPGVGSRTLRKLRRGVSCWQEAWSASRADYLAMGLTERMADRLVAWKPTTDLEALAQTYDQQSIQVVFPEDTEFPRLLRASSDAPGVLFIRGTLTDLPLIAVVGTRRFTTYGRYAVNAMVPALVQSGLGIVSGLALGIDALAHTAALDYQGYTVAVLGDGLDNPSLYPRQNYQLAHRILDQGGCLMSEFPIGVEARREFFPMRNRIIASLTSATLVVEATQKSGSLITAKLALDENREVLAIPGPIWSQGSAGTNTLLQLGAKPCLTANDVLETLALDRPVLVAKARAALPLDADEERLITLLKDPRHVDDLATLAELTVAQTTSKLSLLELKGLVTALGGQLWSATLPV